MIRFINEMVGRVFHQLGYEVQKKGRNYFYPKTDLKNSVGQSLTPDQNKIHYGCGAHLLKGWLNVDLCPGKNADDISFSCNLISRHPFPDNWFEFGFAEDFIEHLNQDDSIIFLSETYRTFKPGGVLRLSFPGLEGVLKRHYRARGYQGAIVCKKEAFTTWSHLHFYSKEELSTVCKYLGFRVINFVEYGKSVYDPLNHLDTRKDQIDLNTYVEIMK
jgi:predicted SAM-dependent methyltransferase